MEKARALERAMGIRVVHSPLIGHVLPKVPIITKTCLRLVLVDVDYKVGMVFEQFKVVLRVKMQVGLGEDMPWTTSENCLSLSS